MRYRLHIEGHILPRLTRLREFPRCLLLSTRAIKFPLVAVDRSSTNRTLLDGALARHNLKFNWFYEVTHLNTSLGLVAGLGISVLPRLATPQEDHPFLVTRAIVNPVVSRTIGIVQRRSSALSPAAEKFVAMLLKTWKTPNT